MNRKAATLAKFALGAAIIFYLIYFVGMSELYKMFLRMNIVYLPFIIALFVLSIAIRALNFKVLLLPHQNKERKFGLSSLLRISFASWAAGIFTPGKLGELYSVYMLKKEGLETGAGAAVSVLNKIVTSVTLLAFAIVGLVKFLGIKGPLHIFPLAAALIILTALPYAALTNRKSRELIKKIFSKIIKRYENQFSGFLDELDNYLARRKRLLMYSFALNVLWIAISSALFVLAFAAFGQRVGFVNMALINAIGTIVSFVPLTIGGTGIREASALVFFGKLGINNATVLSAHIIVAALSFTLAAVITATTLFGKNR